MALVAEPAVTPATAASSDQTRPSIVPHRSYRRLPIRGFRSRLSSTIIVLLVELAVIIFAAPVAGGISRLVATALNGSGVASAPQGDRYLIFNLAPVGSPMASTGYETLVIWLASAVVGIIVLALLRPALPLRYFVISNLTLLVASAAYLIVTGHPGYDESQFSRVYLTTAVTVWLVLPVVVGLVCMLFPFSALETAAIILIALSYDVILCAARYATFLWVLAKTGPVLMLNLYLFFGPLLDFALIVGLFSAALVRLSNKLDKHSEDWEWL